jgi:GxxExxY protein
MNKDYTKILIADKRDPETYAIIGAAMTVHKELGNGFLEPVYQEALAIELKQQNIPFEREPILPIVYKGTQLESSYRADFICYGTIIVELKALSAMSGTEDAQIMNYLKATGLKKALLLNFGKPSVEYKRYIQSKK